ncbi:unnamed protein product [marine sediment metagenome]|uniref:Uncharacterized protein n=1 Tax=marine sediment metagenome TaxID=412755 RepID=X0RIX7_9ZZZZ
MPKATKREKVLPESKPVTIEGLKCPKCEYKQGFRINVAVFVSVSSSGPNFQNLNGVQWDESTKCCCCKCDHIGTVRSFRPDPGMADYVVVAEELFYRTVCNYCEAVIDLGPANHKNEDYDYDPECPNLDCDIDSESNSWRGEPYRTEIVRLTDDAQKRGVAPEGWERDDQGELKLVDDDDDDEEEDEDDN